MQRCARLPIVKSGFNQENRVRREAALRIPSSNSTLSNSASSWDEAMRERERKIHHQRCTIRRTRGRAEGGIMLGLCVRRWRGWTKRFSVNNLDHTSIRNLFPFFFCSLHLHLRRSSSFLALSLDSEKNTRRRRSQAKLNISWIFHGSIDFALSLSPFFTLIAIVM